MNEVFRRHNETMECRFCDHVAHGPSHHDAIAALAAHVKAKHSKEGERAQRLHNQESAIVVDFPQGR